MGYGKEEDAAFHMAAVNRIKEGTGSQAPFATSDFPCCLLDACCIHQMIGGFPPQNKTHIEAAKSS